MRFLVCNADPAVRVFLAMAFALVLSLLQGLCTSLAGLGISIVLALVLAPNLRRLCQNLLVANCFVLFVWLTVPWTMPGTALWSPGPFCFTYEGVELSLRVTIKCNAILLAFLTFMADMKPAGLGCALERLHVPAKLVFLILLTSRYVHVIGDEWKRLKMAAALRGFVPGSNMHTYRTLASMLGLTLVNSMDRAQRVYEAMLLRGFAGHFHMLEESRPRGADRVLVLVCLIVLLALLLADTARVWETASWPLF